MERPAKSALLRRVASLVDVVSYYYFAPFATVSFVALIRWPVKREGKKKAPFKRRRLFTQNNGEDNDLAFVGGNDGISVISRKKFKSQAD